MPTRVLARHYFGVKRDGYGGCVAIHPHPAPRADSGLYCGESIKEGMIDNRMQLMGCKRGRPRLTAFPNSHITRVLYLFNTWLGREGSVSASVARVIISAGWWLRVPSSPGRYGPIVA